MGDRKPSFLVLGKKHACSNASFCTMSGCSIRGNVVAREFDSSRPDCRSVVTYRVLGADQGLVRERKWSGMEKFGPSLSAFFRCCCRHVKHTCWWIIAWRSCVSLSFTTDYERACRVAAQG